MSCWITVGPNPMTSVIIRGKKRQRETHTQGRCHVTRAEVGMMCPQAKECQELLATTRNKERQGTIFSLSAQREHRPANTWISDLQNSATINFCCFKPPNV